MSQCHSSYHLRAKGWQLITSGAQRKLQSVGQRKIYQARVTRPYAIASISKAIDVLRSGAADCAFSENGNAQVVHVPPNHS